MVDELSRSKFSIGGSRAISRPQRKPHGHPPPKKTCVEKVNVLNKYLRVAALDHCSLLEDL